MGISVPLQNQIARDLRNSSCYCHLRLSGIGGNLIVIPKESTTKGSLVHSFKVSSSILYVMGAPGSAAGAEMSDHSFWTEYGSMKLWKR
jgi:hypothetical protein